MTKAEMDKLFRAAADRARSKAKCCEDRFRRRMKRLVEADEMQVERRGYTYGGSPTAELRESSDKVL